MQRLAWGFGNRKFGFWGSGWKVQPRSLGVGISSIKQSLSKSGLLGTRRVCVECDHNEIMVGGILIGDSIVLRNFQMHLAGKTSKATLYTSHNLKLNYDQDPLIGLLLGDFKML